MIRRTIAAGAATSVAAALLVPWGVAANAADIDPGRLKAVEPSLAHSLERGPVLELGTGTAPELYFVQLEAPAVPRRDVAVEEGLTTARSESGYRKELRSEQADLTASISRATGGNAEVVRHYTEALNGVAVRMTRAQAKKVADISGVSAVQVDFERQLTTDKGPQWIGAPEIWEGTEVPAGFSGNSGEGVVVGILDSGLNPANPSFADTVPVEAGGDGYDHTNPLGAGNYLGMCDESNEDQYVEDWGCNDKLIGYYNLEDPEDDGDPFDDVYDDDGHGSHTGSTTAGNRVEATAYAAEGTDNEFSVTSTISGVAPHANIIGYDVCDGGCQGYSIVNSIEQAIIDEVDVINYSIGSSAPSNPWTDLDAVGFLNARAAGIHVATSAGNAGPGAATLGSPGDVPWMTTVGATTHDRKYVASVTDIVAADDATLPDIAGAGLSGPTDGSYPIVDAGAAPYDNPRCGQPGDSQAAGSFPAGTSFVGKIVLCDRGGNGRVEKGENLAELGAEGMILANDEASGDSLNGDAHALPASHITYADGVELRAFMAEHAGAEAALSGSEADVRPENGDIMAAFSSRGPNRAVSSISPSVSAPGVDILAAAGMDNSVEWHFISGTSMASPHTAGALALLKGMQLDVPAAAQWTPAEAQSALMTTAERDITDSDGTAADWFDMGSGRIELRRAAKAGLVLDEDLAGYEAADPAVGGDVRDLNTASMADDECLASCEWTRTFTGTSTGVGTWDVSVENLSDGVTLEADVDSIALTDGGTASVTVTATVAAGTPTDEWLFGTLVLTPPDGSEAPVAHLPVGVLPSSGVLPDAIDITTRRDAGSQVDTDLQAIAISDLQVDASGLVPEDSVELTIVEDTTNPDPFDGNGTHVEELAVPAGATSLIAKLEDPTAPDFDLYVGTGEVSAANVRCQSASAGSDESCEIANPEPGTWWVLVQNWQASPGDVDTTDLVTAVVAGDQGNLRAEGPSGAVPAAEPFSIRTFWDESDMDAGETWHGTLTMGTSPGTPGDIGVVPVVVERIADDVTKTADVTEAAPGDVITYTVDVAPNVAREDFAYAITDPLPAGTSYVEGSASNGATFADGSVTWTGTLEAPSQEDEAYAITTSATDSSCVNPLSGKAEFYDLQSLNITRQPGVTGDGKVFTAGAGFQYGLYEDFGPGVSFSDDGFLLFGGGANYGTAPGVTQSIPDVARPNNVLAMLWQDMQFTYDNAAGAGVSLASDGEGFYIIEFDKMRRKSDPTGAQGTYDYQVFAEAGSNDYVVAYDNLTGPLDGVTIGTENAAGTEADALVNKGDAASVISDDTVVCMQGKPKDVEGSTFSYQVKVDAGVPDGPLTNKLVHTVDNPGAKPASASNTVTINGVATPKVGLSLTPDRIETGATTTATAMVFSTKAAAPTGSVEFWAGDRLVTAAPLDTTGKATATLSGFATAGTVPVTAKYVGDAANAAATSAPVNLVVWKGAEAPAKVRSKIFPKMVKPLEVRTKVKLRMTVRAKDVTPSGEVKVALKGAGKRKTWTVELNKRGKAKVALPKFKRTGKVTVRITYSGDAAVKSSKKKIKFTVVDRRSVR